MNRCPECGAESYPNHGRYSDYKCGSHHTYDGFRQTAQCLTNKLDKLESENAELRRYKAAWDWFLDGKSRKLFQFNPGDYIIDGDTSPRWFWGDWQSGDPLFLTPLLAIESAMKQEATDAEKT